MRNEHQHQHAEQRDVEQAAIADATPRWDAEFWDERYYGAKFKTPYDYVISAVRVSGRSIRCGFGSTRSNWKSSGSTGFF